VASSLKALWQVIAGRMPGLHKNCVVDASKAIPLQMKWHASFPLSYSPRGFSD